MEIKSRSCWMWGAFLVLILAQPANAQTADAISPSRQPDKLATPQIDDPQKDPELSEFLESILDDENMIGVVAAIVSDNKPPKIGCAGLRKRNVSDVPITIQDHMHLGSCTKAMTATLVGVLVEKGHLEWGSTVGETMPELAAKIHKDYRGVTLEQLLLHRSGFPRDAINWWNQGGENISERRDLIAIQSLVKKPKHAAGSHFEYSNLGYMMAGRMAAKTMNKSWEELMREFLFKPLHMSTAGFGPPGTKGKSDQPWGHLTVNKAIRATQFDNSPALGPAGTVHCSLADWAKFAMMHANPNQTFLQKNTWEKLHFFDSERFDGGMQYSLGWLVSQRKNKPMVLKHNGSNNMWLCEVHLIPSKKTAFLVATNIVGRKTPGLLHKIINKMKNLESEK